MAFEHRLIVRPALIAVLLLSTTAEAGSVVYVDDDAAAAGDGSSWNTAYRFLQDAITAASNPGNGIAEIRVAQGVYLPDRDEANPAGTGDRMATFDLINGVVLAGGYAGQGAPDPDARDVTLFETVLDGDLAADDDLISPNACCLPNATPGCDDTACETSVCNFAPNCCDTAWDPVCVGVALSTCTLNCPVLQDNSLHVVTGSSLNDATAVLDGCTITAGYANVNPFKGGGLTCLDGSPTIIACRFESNIAFDAGGAFACDQGSPTISDCVFVGNIAVSGGAITNRGSAVVTGSNFSGNGAFLGGVINDSGEDMTFASCTFVDNSADTGGVMFAVGSHPTFVGCAIMDNMASSSGGAIKGFGLQLTIDRCFFIGNMALDGFGGAISTSGQPVVVNSVFNGNFAEKNGGAIQLTNVFSSGTRFTNCTFTNNIAAGSGGGFSIGDEPVIIENSILWGNTDSGLSVETSQIALSGGAVELNHSCIQGLTGTLGGYGNIGDDPLFADLDGGDGIPGNSDDDLSLAAGTPCANFGIGNLPVDLGTVDIAGNARVQACRIDAGAFESPHFLSDCNANGEADACDLANGVSPDCNGNGILDSCDIAAQTSIDCNGNGLPDECDVTPDVYRVDDGSHEITIVATGGNLIWFNEFRAIADNEVITAVDICWGSTADEGALSDIAIWIDPDDDGDPINAVLVMLMPDVPVTQTGSFVTIPIPPTFVGHTGEIFYVGAHEVSGNVPGCVDQTLPRRRKSWAAIGDNLLMLGNNILPPGILDDGCPECPGNWLIRARRAGASDDMDGNDWPDECAFADLDGDGMVGITDFLWLLGAWGPCDDCDQCPADLDNDCDVGITDFLLLLSSWTL